MNKAQLNDRGQVTIPKKIREKANLKPNDPVKIDLNKKGQIIITKTDYFDDLDDLIRNDLACESLTPYEMEAKVVERKKELASALLKMANEAEEEISKDKYVTLNEFKKEIEKE